MKSGKFIFNDNLFFSKIVENDISGCHEWSASVNNKGYGQFHVRMEDGKKRMVRAHRLAWMIKNGDIPERMLVLHKCDNPKCVNPDHLFIGTNQDNMDDMNKKGRGKPPEIKYGDTHSRAKLTWKDVDCIRHIGSRLTQRKLAEIFGVDQKTIFPILKGETWKEETRPKSQSLNHIKARVEEETIARYDTLLENMGFSGIRVDRKYTKETE